MHIETQVAEAFRLLLEEEKLNGAKRKIDDILIDYRLKPGALIPVLQHTQNIIGYLPPVVQEYVAQGLNLSASSVYGVVSFYSFFTMTPRGKHIIRVCMGTACYVKGGNIICKSLQKKLAVSPGGTTKDRQFTLEVVRCLGACGLAPVVVIDDDTHGQVDPGKAVELLEPYFK